MFTIQICKICQFVRKDKIIKYSSDKTTCAICNENYEVGEILTVTRPCAHQYHHKCLVQWQYHNKDCTDVANIRIMDEPISYRCPLCQQNST